MTKGECSRYREIIEATPCEDCIDAPRQYESGAGTTLDSEVRRHARHDLIVVLAVPVVIIIRVC